MVQKILGFFSKVALGFIGGTKTPCTQQDCDIRLHPTVPVTLRSRRMSSFMSPWPHLIAGSVLPLNGQM